MRKDNFFGFDRHRIIGDYYQHLQRDCELTQLTVTNHTNAVQKVSLWGSNSKVPLTQPETFERPFDKTIVIEKNPTDFIYNPKSHHFFVLHDRGVMTMLSADGSSNKEIDINLLSNVDIKGPVSIDVNSIEGHPNYGDMAVACQRADQLLIFDAQGEYKKTIATGVVPVFVVFNAFNAHFYVANSGADYLSVVRENYQSFQIGPLLKSQHLSVNSLTGDVLVYEPEFERLKVVGIEQTIFTIENIPSDSISVACNEKEHRWYVSFCENSLIMEIDTDSKRVFREFREIQKPIKILYDPKTGLIKVLDKQRVKTTLFEDFKIKETLILQGADDLIELEGGDVRMYLNTEKHSISLQGNIKSPVVSVSEEYFEEREDFQFNPTMLIHLKLIASTDYQIPSLEWIQKSVSGKEESRLISFGNYQSPQNFSTVFEVFELEGMTLDGHSTWSFTIGPLQRVTFLLYHQQLELYQQIFK